VIDTYFKQFFWTFHLVVLFAGAFLVARTINVFVGNALATPAEAIAGDNSAARLRPPTSAHEETTPINAFLERNVFKAAREDLVAEAAAAAEQHVEEGVFNPDQCEQSGVNAELLATIVSSVPEASVAMFADKAKQETDSYKVGDKLMDQAEIMAIEWRRVLVKRSGRCESFSLQEQKEGVPSDAVATAPPPEQPAEGNPDGPKFGEGVKQTGGDEYEIPKAEIDNVLSNLNQIATQARIVPSFHNGKANGFKLFSIRPGSLYSKIGIQNGDIIQKINGFEINSPDKALEIYSKLKDAQSISVDLVRRGKTKSLSYNIR
jgi:general secretion pathway protein C